MSIRRMLFVGNYPNPVDKFRNVFFQNLVFSIADKGVECVVISPISITHYKKRTAEIPVCEINRTKQGKQVLVYHPRFISYSSRKTLIFNTGRWSEHSFQQAAVRQSTQLEGTFDCAYGHFFLGGGLAAIKVGKKLGIPAFVAYGECDYESEVVYSYNQITSKDIDGLNGIISVSTNNLRTLRTKHVFDGIPILLAPNGYDADVIYKMDKQDCRNKLGFSNDSFIVAYVGYFIERKGCLRLSKAIENIPNVKSIFIGSGPQEPECDGILFKGGLPHEEIVPYLNAADVFVLPTLAEGCCNAIIEAMACGLPVISSNLPFNDDILDESNSIRIDPNNIDEIKKAIMRVSNDVALRTRLSEGALTTASKLTIEVRTQRIINFIEETISK